MSSSADSIIPWYKCIMRNYYEAYEERYKTIHAKGYSWAGDVPTPIVLDVIRRYGISKTAHILEIGCGEGRDSQAVLENGYDLLATDISPEAISYCKSRMPQYKERFQVLDCLADKHQGTDLYDMIYAVAVIHMLVEDDDRDRFYAFIRSHLSEKGIALICSMGDGESEFLTDPSEAFTLKERNHPSGRLLVAATSCRMVSNTTFEKEIARSGLIIAEKGITTAMPDFDKLMYAVVRKA